MINYIDWRKSPSWAIGVGYRQYQNCDLEGGYAWICASGYNYNVGKGDAKICHPFNSSTRLHHFTIIASRPSDFRETLADDLARSAATECQHSESNRLGCPECGADFSRQQCEYKLRAEVSPPAWDGEGLPPVGCRCELNRFSDAPESQWVPVEILAHFSGHGLTQPVAVFMPLSSTPHADQATAKCFRPIPTAEQIAAEEREKAIDEMAEDLGKFFSNPRVSARTIYDAGYRKQVKP